MCPWWNMAGKLCNSSRKNRVMNRGRRITDRTKAAIKKALVALLQEKNYPDITVCEITERGNVGRSTFYKHYQSKADVLVDFHKDVFAYLFSGLSTSESWIASEPPSELILFLEKYRRLGRNPFSLSYKLGSDLDFLINNIHQQLATTIEEKLRSFYNDGNRGIPLVFLAQSISNLYRGLIMSWFTKYQTFDCRRYATIMHRMTRALLFEAMGKSPDQNDR